MNKKLRIHFRILVQPEHTSPQQMLQNLVDLFKKERVKIDVELASISNLSLPRLETIAIKGSCPIGQPSSDQIELLSLRDGATSEKDIFFYFIRTTIPTSHGCAAHPEGKPGAVITSTAPPWTLAHELCHILGLFHVEDNKKHLMFLKVNEIVTNPLTNLPSLTANDITKIESNINVLA